MDKTNVTIQVGRRIRALRSARGLTLSKLSEMTRLSEKHIGKVERGTAVPSVEFVAAVARALDIPSSAILEADHEQDPKDLAAEIIAMTPTLSPKDTQIVYRLVKMLTNQ